ncbi:hypothetical protein BDY17DRAFT_313959 [Neohortaea acidophila]|uniref:EDC4-like protein pdc1 beta-propeller domain-containing protein n=1 Tax=Neohortaea acidophila TaxID=245834 RepID=A0A6A6PFB8_9PEZI|nr:uncharacterized protein BDY17DRAFT_313959 [Neohortaea acidophila]KAF2478678.1 hypothetical protein BDY17DRAFT_313959 [Neohortaea acidophila]
MAPPNELQELFNRLKASSAESQPQPQSSIWAQSEQPAYRQPSVSSPIFSPPIHTPNPIHSSNVMSPVNPASNTGTPAPDQTRTNNLLNLLKFNNQGSQSGPMANLQNVGGLRSSSTGLGASEGAAHARPVSAQDMMASFQRKSSSQNVLPSTTTSGGAEKVETTTTQPGSSKDFLLNLLTKPKEAKPTLFAGQEVVDHKALEQAKAVPSVEQLTTGLAAINVQSPVQTRVSREPTPVRQFGTAESTPTPFEAPQPSKASKFSYVNPFDQLHASSPLNASPRPASTKVESNKIEILKHDRDPSSTSNDGFDASSAPPAAKRGKVASEQGSLATAELEKAQSVSEALKGVGERVDKQVEQALAQASAQEKAAPAVHVESAKTGDNAADDEVAIKQEPADDDAGISSWESAEDDAAEATQESAVEVYNFPMRPFVAIHVKEVDELRPIPQDHFMSIAKLHKGFDQIDRCLVTASQSHIIYAQSATKKDNGGFRIIRQDTGDHKQVFRSSGERISNVQICSSATPGDDIEAVLGTGVDGSVFWTTLAKSRGELFADDDVEIQGLMMPPVSTPEEQASGSQIKTRAKMSSRHPEYFAISRGKHIYLVAPEIAKARAYLDPQTRRVNSEKYFAEHGLKITTGKACKDFCFSEDDTMIISLNKSGSLEFWDIRELTTRASDFSQGPHDPLELTEPTWTLHAAASGSKPEEKASVSSVTLIDKERPTSRAIALRYVLIGFKQNHILQLWDLALGKAVQEIRLPHEKDSDGICSLTYHPRSGIVAIGHPTRNSIYFIHLSAPKYTIAAMEQAKYVSLLAREDSTVLRPDSTAIMSGLREFSFAKIGQVRSLDMLAHPIENAAGEKDDEDATLFELYIYHSKGVVGMSVKKQDLGWDKDSKMVRPMDAVKEKRVEVKELVLPPAKPQAPSEISSTAEGTPSKTLARAKKQESGKVSTPSSTTKVEVARREPAPSPAPVTNGSSAKAPVASKPVLDAPVLSPTRAVVPPPASPNSYALAAQRAKSPTQAAQTAVKAANTSTAATTTVAPPSTNDADLRISLDKQFDSLYQRLEGDRRVQDAAGAAKQDAVLRLVSSTLTENVEKSLTRIVNQSMIKEIVPSITDSVHKTVEKKLAETLPKELNSHLSKEVKAALPHAIQQSLKDPHVHNAISTQVAQKVQQQVSQFLQQSLPNLATQAAQKMVSDLDAQTQQKLQQAEARRQQDNAKIQELSNLVQGLARMVQNMSESQAAFQEQILKMQRPGSREGTITQTQHQQQSSAPSTSSVPEPQPQPQPQKTVEEKEVDDITNLLMTGQYDDATVAWLQSPRQAALFDSIFVRVNPRYLEKVAPLIALSVSAAVTTSFDSHVHQRLDWLAATLDVVEIEDADIKELAPKLMDVLSQRLQGAYMNLSETGGGDGPGILKRIAELNRRVVEIGRVAG